MRDLLNGKLEEIDDQRVTVVDPSGVPLEGVPVEDQAALIDFYRRRGLVG